MYSIGFMAFHFDIDKDHTHRNHRKGMQELFVLQVSVIYLTERPINMLTMRFINEYVFVRLVISSMLK